MGTRIISSGYQNVITPIIQGRTYLYTIYRVKKKKRLTGITAVNLAAPRSSGGLACNFRGITSLTKKKKTQAQNRTLSPPPQPPPVRYLVVVKDDVIYFTEYTHVHVIIYSYRGTYFVIIWFAVISWTRVFVRIFRTKKSTWHQHVPFAHAHIIFASSVEYDLHWAGRRRYTSSAHCWHEQCSE